MRAWAITVTDWIQCELGEILTLNYGWSLPKDKRRPGNVPVYGSNGIVGFNDRALVDAPGIIVGRKGSAASVHYSADAFCPIDTTFYVAQCDTSLDLRFLYYLLRHFDLTHIVGDVGVPGLNRDAAYKERARYPADNREQRTIAAVLGKLQAAVAAQQAIIDRTTELKAALMAKLFTEGTRGEPQKETELGPLPQSWIVLTLGDLIEKGQGEIQTGPFGSQLHASDYQTSGVPIVNPTHLAMNSIHADSLPYISRADADRLSKHALNVGDILIARRGDFGRYACINEEQAGWICGTGCMRIRLRNTKIDNSFIGFTFSTDRVQRYLRDKAVGSIMPNLNAKILAQLRIAIPRIDEQREVAYLVSTIDNRLAQAKSQREVCTELFAAMLDELMTGRIRVNNLDLTELGVSEDA